MKNVILAGAVVAFGTALFAACGGSATESPDDKTPGATCDAAKKGFISCGPAGPNKVCQPGQYCSDETFGECSVGCLADVNCACNQVCVVPSGDNVGTCRNNVTAVCGNGACEAGESTASCPGDCPAASQCGNGVCQAGESAASCPLDCGVAAVCGNGVCQAGESTASCPGDCPPASLCGNTVCDANETSLTCIIDCPDYLRQAKEICSSYDFFNCFGPGELQTCFNACDRATPVQLQQYINCGNTGGVSCEPCLQFLP